MDIKEAWIRLEAWYAAHGAPDLGLHGPASVKAIEKLEKAIGLTLPDDFRASLMIHDGQDDGGLECLFPGIPRLASVQQILNQWQEEREWDEDGSMRPSGDDWFYEVLHHPKRIAIAGAPFFDGDRTYLDFIPGPNGIAGQVLTMTTECDFVVFARSFTDMIARTVELLERGELVLEGSELQRKDEPWDGHPSEELAIAKGY